MIFKTIRKKTQRGFTLLELTIVLAIIALLAAMSIPNYGKFQTTMKLNTAARSISSTIRMARSYAVTQRAYYTVRITTNTPPPLRIYVQDSLGNQVGQAYVLPSELNIPNTDFFLYLGDRLIIFNATGGLTNQTQDRSVWIRKATDTSYTTSPLNFKRIFVDSVTGRVTIDETPYS